MNADTYESYLCVPRFIIDAISSFGHAAPALIDLARQLDVGVTGRMSKDTGLRFEKHSDRLGVSIEQAQSQIPTILHGISRDLSFVHVPVDHIPRDMHPEWLAGLLVDGIVVGVGYNFSHISGEKEICRHVSRIAHAIDNDWIVELVDKDEQHATHFRLDWSTLIQSMHEAGGGYWLIGRIDAVTKNTSHVTRK